MQKKSASFIARNFTFGLNYAPISVSACVSVSRSVIVTVSVSNPVSNENSATVAKNEKFHCICQTKKKRDQQKNKKEIYSRIELLPNCKNAAGQTQNRKNFFLAWPNEGEWARIIFLPKNGNYAKSFKKKEGRNSIKVRGQGQR